MKITIKRVADDGETDGDSTEARVIREKKGGSVRVGRGTRGDVEPSCSFLIHLLFCPMTQEEK